MRFDPDEILAETIAGLTMQHNVRSTNVVHAYRR